MIQLLKITAPVAALVGALSASSPGVDKPATVRLDRVELRLFYLASGRLSENMLDKPYFAGWNTIIGSDDAGEPADDVLVTANLSSVKGGEAFVLAPAEVLVRNSKGKILGVRRWSHVFIPQQGNTRLALWIKDATCAGELTVIARFNGSVKTGRVTLDCGE